MRKTVMQGLEIYRYILNRGGKVGSKEISQHFGYSKRNTQRILSYMVDGKFLVTDKSRPKSFWIDADNSYVVVRA